MRFLQHECTTLSSPRSSFDAAEAARANGPRRRTTRAVGKTRSRDPSRRETRAGGHGEGSGSRRVDRQGTLASAGAAPPRRSPRVDAKRLARCARLFSSTRRVADLRRSRRGTASAPPHSRPRGRASAARVSASSPFSRFLGRRASLTSARPDRASFVAALRRKNKKPNRHFADQAMRAFRGTRARVSLRVRQGGSRGGEQRPAGVFARDRVR